MPTRLIFGRCFFAACADLHYIHLFENEHTQCTAACHAQTNSGAASRHPRRNSHRCNHHDGAISRHTRRSIHGALRMRRVRRSFSRRVHDRMYDRRRRVRSRHGRARRNTHVLCAIFTNGSCVDDCGATGLLGWLGGIRCACGMCHMLGVVLHVDVCGVQYRSQPETCEKRSVESSATA